MSKRRKSWIRFVLVVFAICFIFFVPYKSTVSPQWNIQVVDESGNPVPGLLVTEEWSYFGIDLAPSLDNGKTDAQGRITFPVRVIWAPLVSRLLNFEGAQRVGPSTWVLACDESALIQGEFFWDGSRFQLGGHRQDSRE